MSNVIHIVNAHQLTDYKNSSCYKDFDIHSIQSHEVDHHAVYSDENGQVHARCSLWWKMVPTYPNERLGVIGHFFSDNPKATKFLLTYACGVLRKAGCSLAVGPMDGNTWRHYRFISERGNETEFFLEPDNADHWPDEFMENGFSEMASYSSALNTDLTVKDKRLVDVRQRLEAQGITVRSLDMMKFEDELAHIYALSVTSFQENFLYTSIDKDEFIEMYAKIKPYVQADLTLLAEHKGELVGYLFSIPDLLQKQRGKTIDTFIIKTVTVASQYRGSGLGGLLVGEAQCRAHKMGYCRAIHALMYDDNSSRNISSHYAKVIRRYSLYHKQL